MLYNGFSLVIDRKTQKNWQEKGISKKKKNWNKAKNFSQKNIL